MANTQKGWYLTSAEYAAQHGISDYWLREMLRQGRIPSARFFDGRWHIPQEAPPPERRRKRPATVPAADGFMTVAEAASRWHRSAERVRQYCTAGLVAGAVNRNGRWEIPDDAELPELQRGGRRHG